MVQTFLSLKGFAGRAACFLVLLFVCSLWVQRSAATTADNSEACAIISAYENTQNVIEKRKALRQVTEYSRVRASKVAQWQKDILRDALEHKDPTVVESAVHKIGELNLSEFNANIISLYHRAHDLYANAYDRRVMIGIVFALGKTGKDDQNVFNLFQEILDPAKTSFCYIQGDVLNTIKVLNNTQYLPMVEKYRKYMDSAITTKESAGEDIMMYQVLIGYKTLCENIIQELRP